MEKGKGGPDGRALGGREVRVWGENRGEREASELGR